MSDFTPYRTCSNCHGIGIFSANLGFMGSWKITCRVCHGTGRMPQQASGQTATAGNPQAKHVMHHDDSPCTARLTHNGVCPECNLVPDMQSLALYYYCPFCDVELKRDMTCPACKQQFDKPA